CARDPPPNPTTAATATIANNLFLISALLRSPGKLSRGFSDHEMWLLHSCHVHADQARLHVGKPGFDLALRPFPRQHNPRAVVVSHEVERVLSDIDADHGNCAIEFL